MTGLLATLLAAPVLAAEPSVEPAPPAPPAAPAAPAGGPAEATPTGAAPAAGPTTPADPASPADGPAAEAPGIASTSVGSAVGAPPAPVPPGALALSLDDALRRAQETSESVEVAESQVEQAAGDRWSARAGYLPQVSGSITYQRTIETEFDDLFTGFGAPPTGATPPTTTPITTTPTGEPPTGDDQDGGGSLPFGQPNTWRAGFTINQSIFGGGRTWALNKIANAGARSAEVGLESARASAALDTASAYYDAALSDRLLEIATSSLAQAEATLRQTELAQGVGRQPEFELLRARVTVDNQRVAVINARRQRDLAHQRLAQLIELPPESPLVLTSPLEQTDVTALAVEVSGARAPDAVRAPVRQLTELATIAEASTAIARADALPSLGASVNIGWVSFPQELLPLGEDSPWYASSNAAVALNVPLFNGGRLWGAYRKARGSAAQAQAQLDQTAELADLDARQAQAGLDAASAQWTATEGVVEQARRAYEIAELRFTEGVSTQLELSDARLQLEQALVNRAQAARDLAVAKIRMALLSSLPLSTPSF